MVVIFCIFCFKPKTAYEMRISDWSSDVCSSDLKLLTGRGCQKRRILYATGCKFMFRFPGLGIKTINVNSFTGTGCIGASQQMNIPVLSLSGASKQSAQKNHQ